MKNLCGEEQNNFFLTLRGLPMLSLGGVDQAVVMTAMLKVCGDKSDDDDVAVKEHMTIRSLRTRRLAIDETLR